MKKENVSKPQQPDKRETNGTNGSSMDIDIDTPKTRSFVDILLIQMYCIK